MTTNPDFADAKEFIKTVFDDESREIAPQIGTILLALRIAAALTREPSMDVEIAGMEKSCLSRPSVDDSAYVNSIFKAMVNQLIKEAENAE